MANVQFQHLASFIFGGLPANYDAIIGLIVKMVIADTATFEINSCIRGYHAYRRFGQPLSANTSAAIGRGIKLGKLQTSRQIAKFKSSPNFPAIQYVLKYSILHTVTYFAHTFILSIGVCLYSRLCGLLRSYS